MGEKDAVPANYYDSRSGTRAPHTMGLGGVGSTGYIDRLGCS